VQISPPADIWLNELAATWNSLLAATNLRTPAYVYSRKLLSDRLANINTAFASHELCILASMKANPSLPITKVLADQGTGFDVASEGELRLAKEAGASFISLVGPGKTTELIHTATGINEGQIVLESLREVRIFGKAIRGATSCPAVLLRVNPAGEATKANEVMGGAATQFGTDEEEIPELLVAAERLGISVRGLHYHLGSQIRDIAGIRANVDLITGSVTRIFERTGFSPAVLNFGGGFGLPHHPSHPPVLDPGEIAAVMGKAVEHLAALVGGAISGQVELGRYLYAPVGVYICRVVEVKESRGRGFVVVDCGVSGFSRPAMRWGEWHPVWRLGEVLGVAEQSFDIVGPTCLPGDRIAQDVCISRPREGDLLIVGLVGAYGYSMSLLRWGSLNQPVREIVI
jgi:diaminopimelate decarboxylase